MKLRNFAAAVAAVGGLALSMGAVSTTAQAATLTGFACSTSDLTVTTGTVDACAGFYEGNLNNNASVPDLKTILGGLGLDTSFFDAPGFDFDDLQKIEDEDATSVDFTGLSGITYIGLHFGNGQGSPGRPAGSRGDGNDTAFYRINVTGPGDLISFDFNSFSNAVVYSTGGDPGGPGTGGPIPEPGTWALMIMGFGAAGAMLRRRRTAMA